MQHVCHGERARFFVDVFKQCVAVAEEGVTAAARKRLAVRVANRGGTLGRTAIDAEIKGGGLGAGQ